MSSFLYIYFLEGLDGSSLFSVEMVNTKPITRVPGTPSTSPSAKPAFPAGSQGSRKVFMLLDQRNRSLSTMATAPVQL
jgi:hypothetical protein